MRSHFFFFSFFRIALIALQQSNPLAFWAARVVKNPYHPPSVRALGLYRALGSVLLQLADFHRNLLTHATTIMSTTGNRTAELTVRELRR